MIAAIVPMAKRKEHADSDNNGIGVGIGQDIVDGGFPLAGGIEERNENKPGVALVGGCSDLGVDWFGPRHPQEVWLC